jgi:hypothetical protein
VTYVEHIENQRPGWYATCDECGWISGPHQEKAEAWRLADQHDLAMGEVRPEEL